MTDFDPDDGLRQEFQRRAGEVAGVGTALDVVLARAGHIRRRRAAIAGSGALIALVVGGLVLIPRGGSQTLAPAETDGPRPTVEETIDSTADVTTIGAGSTLVDATVDTTPAGRSSIDIAASTMPDTTVSGRAPSTTSSKTSTTRPIAPITSPATTSSTSASSSSSSSSSSTDAPAPTLEPFTRTYQSMGGSITVNWNGSAFTLLSVAPAPGFNSEIEDEDQLRVRVRFRSTDADARIEVRVNDGVLIVNIS